MLFSLLTGCVIYVRDDKPLPEEDPPHDTGIACTDIAFASVMVTVTDQDGNPVGADRVTYTVDGGEQQVAVCSESWDESGPCSEWVAGWEQPGRFVIEARYEEDTDDPCCWDVGYGTAQTVVELDPSGCHVETRQVTIALDPQRVCADGEDCG